MNSQRFGWLRTWGGPLVLLAILLLAPIFLSDFRLNQLGKFLTYAIAALGLSLIWGYGGMLSLGQGLFFGLGAYGFALYLKLLASGEKLPDFMFWSGLTELPWFWRPFGSPIFALAAALIVPAAVAGTLGYFIFRSRVQGVYFSIITQALTLLVSIWFVGQQAYTGGTNGITNFGNAVIFGAPVQSYWMKVAFYLASAVLLALVWGLLRLLVNSRYGRVLQAVRDNEDRVRFLGYSTVTIKVAAFALSAMIAGLAGILFVPQVGIISPSSLGVAMSLEMVVWVAVGGRGALFGAIIGALAVNYGKSWLSESYPDIWSYFLGFLIILTVVIFPSGIVGGFAALPAKFRALRTRLTQLATRRAGLVTMPTPPVALQSTAQQGGADYDA
jgi:urea transport system permease protein